MRVKDGQSASFKRLEVSAGCDGKELSGVMTYRGAELSLSYALTINLCHLRVDP